MKTCKYCNKEIKDSKLYYLRVFCSRECTVAQRKKESWGMYKHCCKECGINLNKTKINQLKEYCTDKCMRAKYSKKLIHIKDL